MLKENWIAKTENDKLLSSFLNRYYFNQFADKNNHVKSIEFFLKGDCPSKCSYCYLQKHLKDLYPCEYDNDEKILEHVKIFLKFYIESEFKCDIELFSGRMFYNGGIGLKVLQLLYDAFKDQVMTEIHPKVILIPDDMQFLLDDDITAEIEKYIELFQSINIDLGISASVDGKYCDYLRFGDRADEFYDKLFKFSKNHHCGLHPMLSSFNVKNWKDNIGWWIENNPNFFHNTMILAVRDNNWTEEKLVDYVKLLDYAIEELLKYYCNDTSEFLKSLFNYRKEDVYAFWKLPLEATENEPYRDRITCASQQMMHVRMGDLAIVSCHRLAYPQYIAGKFITDNDEIVGIEANNPSLLISTNSIKFNSLLKCSSCGISKFCMGTCLGSNFENMGDPFYPVDTVCDLYKLDLFYKTIKLNKLNMLEDLSNLYPYAYDCLIDAYNSIRNEYKYDLIVKKAFKSDEEEDEDNNG